MRPGRAGCRLRRAQDRNRLALLAARQIASRDATRCGGGHFRGTCGVLIGQRFRRRLRAGCRGSQYGKAIQYDCGWRSYRASIEPLQFLLSAKRHLAPAGRIVLTTPYPFSLAYGMYAVWKYPRTCQNHEHTCWFCPTTLTELAARAGLNVRHFELIENYRSDAPSLVYRSGLRVLRAARRCLPLRFGANGMLFVLEDSCGAP